MKMRRGAQNATDIKWFDALDFIGGTYPREQDIAEGLRLARECNHTDALWLCALVPEDDVARDVLMKVMLSQGGDPRALFVAFFCGDVPRAVALLAQAAEKGYAPAQSRMASFASSAARKAMAEEAATKHDRLGLTRLGLYLWHGTGCDADEPRAMECWRAAAQMGCSQGQCHLSDSLLESDWRRYYWAGRSLLGGDFDSLYMLFHGAQSEGDRRVLYEIGEACVNGDVLDGRFDRHLDADAKEALQVAIGVYNEGCDTAKRAIECWLGVGRRLRVVKDIRGMVAGMLWEQRWEWAANE
jgi:TPR repeat protein